MAEMENWLLVHRVRAAAGRVAATDDPDERDAVWRELERDLDRAGAGEVEEIALPVLEQSLEDVHALLDAWDAGTLSLPEWDKAVLRRAMKAYRKRLKLVRLDDESSSSRNPLSRGEESHILGVRPPQQYPQEIWDFLVAQGRLREGGGGLLEPGSV